jgi:hypothetical protein
MYLFTGVLILSCVFLGLSLALICCRNPNSHWYAGETMQIYVWTLFPVSGMVFGPMFIVKSLTESLPSGFELVLTASTIAAAIVVYRLLRVRERLASFEAETARGKLIKVDSFGERNLTPPTGKKPHHPFFKKAA